MRYFAAFACVALFASSAAFGQAPFVSNSVQQTLNAYDPLNNHDYQVQGEKSCTSAGVCEVSFPVLKRKTLIQHVSCFIVVAGNSQAPTEMSVAVNTPSGNVQQNYLPVFSYGPNTFVSGDFNYGVNSDVNLAFNDGMNPEAFVITSAGTADLNCTLSGYHV